MGTQTIGQYDAVEAGFATSATCWVGAEALVSPGDIYIDDITINIGPYPSGPHNAIFFIWETGTNTVVAQTASTPINGKTWHTIPLTSKLHLTHYYGFRIGAWVSGGMDIRTDGHTSTHNYSKDASGPSTFSGYTTNRSGGIGGLAAYCSYFPPCSLSSPSTGHARKGDTITINGQSFNAGITGVAINGAAASWTPGSDTSFTATVPSGAASSGSIVVTTNAGSASWSTFVVDPLITGTSVSHATQGATVHIYGSGMDSVNAVYFNGANAGTITHVNDGDISIVIPSGATSGPIMVTNGQAWPQTGTVNVDPTFSSFDPGNGGVGTTISLHGTGLTGVTSVAFFNNASASFTHVSDTLLTAQVPNGAQSGPISLISASLTVQSATSYTVSGGFYKTGDVQHALKGVYYKTGGALYPLKGWYYKTGDTLHPIK